MNITHQDILFKIHLIYYGNTNKNIIITKFNRLVHKTKLHILRTINKTLNILYVLISSIRF